MAPIIRKRLIGSNIIERMRDTTDCLSVSVGLLEPYLSFLFRRLGPQSCGSRSFASEVSCSPTCF